LTADAASLGETSALNVGVAELGRFGGPVNAATPAADTRLTENDEVVTAEREALARGALRGL
jgi:hypothetical protein